MPCWDSEGGDLNDLLGAGACLEILLHRRPFPSPCPDLPLWCMLWSTEAILLKRNNPVKAQCSFWPPLAPQPGLSGGP